MAISFEELENKLKKSFPEAKILIKDTVGDNDHYHVEIECLSFMGLNLVDRHRLVNQSLSDCLGGQLHALSIKTKIPQ